MLTGEIRSQIDQICNAFWTCGISNPLEVIEQIHLLFLKRLDDIETAEFRSPSRFQQTRTLRVVVENNSIHDFTKDGVQAINAGVTAEVKGNRISGIGPTVPFSLEYSLPTGRWARLEVISSRKARVGAVSYQLLQRTE